MKKDRIIRLARSAPFVHYGTASNRDDYFHKEKMILVIDGYNVIHAIKEFELALDRGLKEARASLISFCVQALCVRRNIDKIFVVFDGTSGFHCDEENPHPKINILYTPTDEDADDRIIEILRSYTGKNQVTVVTNDNYVANNARSLSASVLSASEFERYAAPRNSQHPKTSGNPHSAPKISATAAKSITEEYKKFLGIS